MCSSNAVLSCLTAFSSLRPTPCTLSVSALKVPMTELGLTAFYDKGTPVTTACPLSSEAMPCSSSAWPDTLHSLAFWSSSRTPVSTGSGQYIVTLTCRAADIERTYGQRKPLAARSPIQPRPSRVPSEDSLEFSHIRKASSSSFSSISSIQETPTPAATEGETATESEELITDIETETEMARTPSGVKKFRALSSKSSKDSFSRPASPRSRQSVSQHDLFHRYFRKDALLVHNLDLFR